MTMDMDKARYKYDAYKSGLKKSNRFSINLVRIDYE